MGTRTTPEKDWCLKDTDGIPDTHAVHHTSAYLINLARLTSCGATKLANQEQSHN